MFEVCNYKLHMFHQIQKIQIFFSLDYFLIQIQLFAIANPFY